MISPFNRPMTSERRSLFWKIVKWFFLILAGIAVVVITALILAGVWVSWSGHREWEQTRSALLARGEKLSLVELAPSPIPDNQNFFADPVWLELADPADTKGNDFKKREPRLPEGKRQLDKLTPPLSAQEVTDLKKQFPDIKWPKTIDARVSLVLGLARILNAPGSTAVETQESAACIFALLAPCRPMMDYIKNLAKRPDARFPLVYQDGMVMNVLHLQYILRHAQLLMVDAQANLVIHNSQAACDDVRLLFRLSKVEGNEPLLMSLLIRGVTISIIVAVIEKGITAHAWTETELADFQYQLGELHLLQDLPFTLRGDRGGFNQMMQREISVNAGFSASPQGIIRKLRQVCGKIFLESDQAFYNKFIQQRIEILESGKSPAKDRPLFAEVEEMNRNPSLRFQHFLSLLAISPLPGTVQRICYTQDQVIQARIACALERYRLTYDTYPQTLSALVPDYMPSLPDDPLTLQPMKYRLVNPDEFQLWSVGWNLTDEGGKQGDSIRNGDWVWRQEAYPPRHSRN